MTQIIQTLVRPGELSDAETIAQFNIDMALETEQKSLSRETVVEGVRRLLGMSDAGFYIVAEREVEIVGCLMVTFEWSDWRDAFFWWIQSVYVRPAHRRQGVFRRLFAHVRDMAGDRADVCGLRLYVEQSNAIAQRTYTSLSMKETPYRVFEIDSP